MARRFILRMLRMRESHEEGDGTLRQDISTAMVGLYKEHFGGAERCTYLPRARDRRPGWGYSAAEQTLLEAGKWYGFARRG